MECLRTITSIIVLLNIWKIVLCDYPCICNYHVELTVTNSPDDKGTLIGYMYEFDCKPQAFVKDLDSKWLAVAFEKKLGYVQKDEQVQIQKCPGNQPEEDKLPTTTTIAPSQSTTTKYTTTMQSTVTSTFLITTTQATVTTKPSTTTTQATVTTTQSTPTTQTTFSTVPSTTSTQARISTVPTTTSTAETISTVPFTTSTQATISTVPSTTTTQATIFTVPSTATTQETISHVPSNTSTQATISIVPSITTTQATMSTVPSTTTTQVAATHILLNSSDFITQGQCPSDAVQFKEYCYKIETADKREWTFAELNCNIKGGHLLSISHPLEPEYIYQLLKAMHVHEPVWTGLNDKDREENFIWSSDINTVKAISTTEPRPSEVHVALQIQCRSLNGGPVLQTGNKCFEYVNKNLTWSDAKRQCDEDHYGIKSVLAEIDDRIEETDLEKFLNEQHVTQYVWIGLNDLANEGQFVWSSGSAVKYTKLSTSNQILNEDRYDCVVIKPDGFWEKEICYEPPIHPDGRLFTFICMYTLPSPGLIG